MPDIKFTRKSITIIAALAVTAIIILFMIGPLNGKVRLIGQELEALERESVAARDIIHTKNKVDQEGSLLTRKDVSRAINEITRVGTLFGINFLSTKPQNIEQLKGSKYPVLPIRMNIQSEYKNFGLFLGGLERLKESIVTVRSFQIQPDEDALPKVKVELVVEIYLQEGEGE